MTVNCTRQRVAETINREKSPSPSSNDTKPIT